MANLDNGLPGSQGRQMIASRNHDHGDVYTNDPTQLARMRSTISSNHGNTYGTTNIGGQASVVIGNTYINYFSCGGRPFTLSMNLNLGFRHYEAFNPTVKTRKSQAQYHILPWLLFMTRDYVTRRSSRGTERSLFWRLSCFGKYIMYMGISFEPSGDFRVYRPRLRNVVPEDSQLILACQRGDLASVRHLLTMKMASPHDVTPEDRSPLYFAINGGHEHVVQELLDHGADVNQSFGPNQASPLAWALYKRNHFMGACLQHISNTGWSLLPYLWSAGTDPQPPCLEFMNILLSADPDLFKSLESHIVDSYGWVPFSRVACLGTPEDLDFLINWGANVYFKNEFDWNALFEAVYGGKLGNVQKLIPFFPDFLVLRDTRGWTLLHVAAEEGHDEIVRFLLLQGADWQSTSWPSSTEIPEPLRGLCCTPQDAARAQSEDRAQRYLIIVAECQHAHQQDP